MMKVWMRKLFVSVIAVLTLGLYVPPTFVDANNAEEKDTYIPSNQNDSISIENIEAEHETTEQSIIEQLTKKALNQTKTKLGSKIMQQVDEEFTTVILPKIEEELQFIFANVEQDHLTHFQITENPAAGYGERIFNIFDYETNQTVAKFHIRREYRPLEGHWFNFHYHLVDDQFETHYPLGDIFWDKNTPPKWMTH